jgi:hypothetical protein
MLYHNTKFKFALAEGAPASIQGGIIAASAMPGGQLVRRVRAGFRRYPYLQHRLFDPQLYLCGLDKYVARKAVINLATHAWFTPSSKVPDYDSDQHGSIKNYKAEHESALLDEWIGEAPSTPADIERAVRACVTYQLELGCEGIILPSPMTTIAAMDYQCETEWLDIGAAVCREMRVPVPVYASIALSDGVLRGVNPFISPLINTITNQVASRDELAGAYVVVAQTADTGYVCNSRDVLLSLLVISDDLVRGAGRKVLVNYMGTFGAVLSAAGTGIWSTGYYRSQRRLVLSDYEENMALAQPRFFSFGLTGDIGLEKHLPIAYAKGIGRKLTEPVTAASTPLIAALEAGTYPMSTPQWEYRSNNLTAATAHYLSLNDTIARAFDSLDPAKRVDFIRRWLFRAAGWASELAASGMRPPVTDSLHQPVWLSAYDDWLAGRQ